ncbi:aldehyde dehydrogenase [Variovorax paradoxus]|nr:aldehyde dehydrogenase family protein [Variovorax paradoxus]MBT2305203.1 aldehyde dehydrogenase [Variovorax paradoxus]
MNESPHNTHAQQGIAFLNDGPKKHFIDGNFQPSMSGESIEAFNPATGKRLALLARGRKEDVDAAVSAARKAFEGPWSRFTPHQRATLLMKVVDVLERNYEELATLETLDMGAPLKRTLAMKNVLMQTVTYFSAQALNWSGSTIPNSLPGNFTTLTIKAPLGVVGGIIPWNAPLISMWWIIGGALATGCTAVIKPAEDASLTTLRTAQLLVEAGVPAGVINVVTGLGGEAGEALSAHPDVDRIVFTGSTVTGRKIIQASAVNMKRVQLELGGKSPDIVFADANLDKAVPGAAMGVYNNSGQICTAGTRVFVQRSIHEEFVARLADYSKKIKVGDPFDPDTQLGPLVSEAQLKRVMSYVELGGKEGATLAAGGTRLGGDLANGYYVAPTVFDGVHNDMRIAREEIFGPVLSLITFDTEEEALKLANDTAYGLGGGFWTSNIRTLTKMMNGIKAGKIWVNCWSLNDPAAGFAGYKQSGYGVKGGRDHVEGFLYEKTIYINGD